MSLSPPNASLQAELDATYTSGNPTLEWLEEELLIEDPLFPLTLDAFQDKDEPTPRENGGTITTSRVFQPEADCVVVGDLLADIPTPSESPIVLLHDGSAAAPSPPECPTVLEHEAGIIPCDSVHLDAFLANDFTAYQQQRSPVSASGVGLRRDSSPPSPLASCSSHPAAEEFPSIAEEPQIPSCHDFSRDQTVFTIDGYRAGAWHESQLACNRASGGFVGDSAQAPSHGTSASFHGSHTAGGTLNERQQEPGMVENGPQQQARALGVFVFDERGQRHESSGVAMGSEVCTKASEERRQGYGGSGAVMRAGGSKGGRGKEELTARLAAVVSTIVSRQGQGRSQCARSSRGRGPDGGNHNGSGPACNSAGSGGSGTGSGSGNTRVSMRGGAGRDSVGGTEIAGRMSAATVVPAGVVPCAREGGLLTPVDASGFVHQAVPRCAERLPADMLPAEMLLSERLPAVAGTAGPVSRYSDKRARNGEGSGPHRPSPPFCSGADDAQLAAADGAAAGQLVARSTSRKGPDCGSEDDLSYGGRADDGRRNRAVMRRRCAWVELEVVDREGEAEGEREGKREGQGERGGGRAWLTAACSAPAPWTGGERVSCSSSTCTSRLYCCHRPQRG